MKTMLTIDIVLSGDGYCESLEIHNKTECTRTEFLRDYEEKITVIKALRLIKEELFYYGY